MTVSSNADAIVAARSAATVRPAIWGVLNVTPDSFSDGGQFVEPEVALAHARRLVADGASVIDVGGESTRPGAEAVSPAVERGRVVPIVAALASEGIHVSIDTMNAATAAAAVDAGAVIVNDVSGGLADADMARLVAELEVEFVATHWRGPSENWDSVSDYRDAPTDVRDALRVRRDALLAAGISPERLWLDPGLGFAKLPHHNWQLLAQLDELTALGSRVLVGASRKRFLAALLPEGAPVEDRDLPTAVVSALAAGAGAHALRVHDVLGTARALDVVDAWRAQVAPRDAIALTGLRARGHHGVYDHEKRDGQEFIIDVRVALDLAAAAASDNVADTLHYGELASAIVHAVETDPVDLIETVAERVAALVLRSAAAREVQVTVHKPHAPMEVPFDDVSVTIVRRRP